MSINKDLLWSEELQWIMNEDNPGKYPGLYLKEHQPWVNMKIGAFPSLTFSGLYERYSGSSFSILSVICLYVLLLN